MPNRVPASTYERAVSELRDELQGFTVQDAVGLRSSALAAVTDWRWSKLGAPGIGDYETDLRLGNRSPWLQAPPPDDNEHYGLDAGGRVRIIQRRIQGNVQVVEHSPTRVRSLIIDDTGVLGIDDVHLDGARYVSSVAVNTHGWSFRSFEYDGDRFRSVWIVSYVEADPDDPYTPPSYAPGVTVMTRTASYGANGRLRKLTTVLEDPSADPSPPSAPAVMDGGQDVDVTGAMLTAEEDAFADALTRAIVADLGAHPPNGTLARFVLRWFEWRDPGYLTLHALGTGDEYAHEDAWLPLEWSNLDDELERTQRVLERAEVAQASANLGPIYELVEDIPDEHPPPPAIRAVIKGLPQALAAVPRTDYFAVAASHFEAYGMLDSLQASNPRAAIDALAARDELPPDE